jgi:hypothetical protein
VASPRVECIARCYERKRVPGVCNCVCLGQCHGAGYCLGPHRPSDWGQTIHGPARRVTRPAP